MASSQSMSIGCSSSFPNARTPFSNITNDLNIRTPLSNITNDYLDHGDQNVTCQKCNSKLWLDESLRGWRDHSKRTFSLCCSYGKVVLPVLKQPQHSYKNLYSDVGSKSNYFLKNIRRYNLMFSFTSMGGKIDKSINRGKVPWVFRLSGQNYHSIGSLLPQSGFKPKFSQLYIYDTENEVTNRQSIFGDVTGSSKITDLQIIQQLKDMLDSENELVKCYRMVRDTIQQNPHIGVKLRLIGKRGTDGRTYNLPIASEVATLIMGDIGNSYEPRDIIVKSQSGRLERISELYASYLPLQYPLLFPYGEDGYRPDIPHADITEEENERQSFVSMREWFAYMIQDRVNTFSLILNSRRLLWQLLVDAYTMIESERLFFIRFKQKELRCESYENLRNVQNLGNTDMSTTGQRVILPSSFTGGARYMMQNYLDAMSLCKSFGYPDFFITITCNPKWLEIQRFLKNTTLKAEDRPDILCRLFKMKLDSLIKDLKDNSLLGKVQAVVYTNEFQKRGLSHAHICLFMHSDHKIPNVEHIDPLISAEIPNKDEDPELYSLVSEYMIHGPCGAHNLNCPCMVDRRCTKNFLKKFREHTSIDNDGFPLYRRRDCGSVVVKSDVSLDNRSVVPYNKLLLKTYQAHINVEWCNQARSIKYLFKYINKSPDRVMVSLTEANKENNNDDLVDEIKEIPSVMRLPFHLPRQQQVMYEADDDIDNVLNKPSIASSMFLSWMECNDKYKEARNLSYVEFPTKFVWKMPQRRWQPRKRGFSLGRIHSVSPSLGEAYFLRILLNKVKGPKCFEDIRTVNGHVYNSYRDACYALGLLDDDKEYIEAIEESSYSGSRFYIRSLFATMLMSNCLSRPDYVWNNTLKYLSDDILHRQQIRLKDSELSLNDEQLKNLALFEIETILLRNNSSLRRFQTMPYPDHDNIASSNNHLISEELSYNSESLKSEFVQLFNSLTDEQRNVYDEIMASVTKDNGWLFFVYGYGGTGKTYLWKTLSAAIRSKSQIVLNVASSGIASLLLSGGRTTHSRFHIPLNLTEDSICYMKPGSEVSHLLKKTSLIIWDEAPMIHKHALEALDRSLQDIMNCGNARNRQIPFGGKEVVFGGDFRQILPVVTNGSRQDVVNASICSSYLWSKCKVLQLTRNMRLSTGTDTNINEESRIFSQWLLDLGEGNIGGPNDGESNIYIPEDLLINDSADTIGDLIDFVYPDILDNLIDQQFFQDRAMLAPKNDVVQEINDRLLSIFPGDEMEYLSSDSIYQEEHVNESFDEQLYSPEFLNGIKASGLPNHRLVLKVGVPVMLLRNIDQKRGLCNGTRLRIISLGTRVVEAEVLTDNNIGE